MKNIGDKKEIKRGNYTLVHTIVPGMFGEPSNSFELVRLETEGKDKGMLFSYPFHPPIVVTNRSRTDSIFKLDTFTDEQYDEWLTEHIEKVEGYRAANAQPSHQA